MPRGEPIFDGVSPLGLGAHSPACGSRLWCVGPLVLFVGWDWWFLATGQAGVDCPRDDRDTEMGTYRAAPP